MKREKDDTEKRVPDLSKFDHLKKKDTTKKDNARDEKEPQTPLFDVRPIHRAKKHDPL